MASFNSWHNELNRDVLPEDGVEYTAAGTAAIC
jgi:beta-glucosidase